MRRSLTVKCALETRLTFAKSTIDCVKWQEGPAQAVSQSSSLHLCLRNVVCIGSRVLWSMLNPRLRLINSNSNSEFEVSMRPLQGDELKLQCVISSFSSVIELKPRDRPTQLILAKNCTRMWITFASGLGRVRIGNSCSHSEISELEFEFQIPPSWDKDSSGLNSGRP